MFGCESPVTSVRGLRRLGLVTLRWSTRRLAHPSRTGAAMHKARTAVVTTATLAVALLTAPISTATAVSGAADRGATWSAHKAKPNPKAGRAPDDHTAVGPDLNGGKPLPIKGPAAAVHRRPPPTPTPTWATPRPSWPGMTSTETSTSRTTRCAGSATTSRCGSPTTGPSLPGLPQRPRPDRDHRPPGQRVRRPVRQQHLPQGVGVVLDPARPRRRQRSARCHPRPARRLLRGRRHPGRQHRGAGRQRPRRELLRRRPRRTGRPSSPGSSPRSSTT